MAFCRPKQCLAVAARTLSSAVPPWECHAHTVFTDGQMTVREAVAAALSAKLTRIVFAEHSEAWKSSRPGWFPEYAAEIAEARKRHGNDIEIFAGAEVPAADYGLQLDITEEMKSQADFLLGTVHRYPCMGDRKTVDLEPPEAIEMEHQSLMALAKNTEINAIAHIGGTCAKYVCPFPLDLARQVVREATRNGIAIELNSTYHCPMQPMLQICVEEDALVTLGSDAHCVDEVGLCFRQLTGITKGKCGA